MSETESRNDFSVPFDTGLFQGSSEPIATYLGVVYPWHCDHMGHMNVMWYVSMFDEATWHFFGELGLTAERFREERIGMAAVEQHIKYIAELVAGDLVEIHTRLVEATDKTLVFEHTMSDRTSSEPAAWTRLVGVHFDTDLRRARDLPDDVKAKVEKLLSKT